MVKNKIKIEKVLKIILFIIIVGVFIFYISKNVLNLIKQPTNSFILSNGDLYLEENVEGYIIRDEVVVQGENYENGMLKIKNEGERVAKGEAIFRYYSENEENIKDKIEEVEKQIQENMPSNEEIMSSDITSLDEQIKTEIDNIAKSSELQKIKEYKSEIQVYLDRKIQLIGESNNISDDIKNLIKQKQNYENELTKNSEYINAPISGEVSYRVDGLEEILKTDDFSYLNEEFLNSLNLRTGSIVPNSEEKGKIIKNFECYIAVMSSSDEAKRARIGDEITIQLSNSEKIEAEIEYINIENDDSRLLVLKITNNIEKLNKYRKISFDIIWWDYTGLKVPNSAIIEENGRTYLERKRAESIDKILVKVQRQNENYSIVDNYDSDELKELGYTEDEISNMKKIYLHDEIIITNK